MNTETDEYFPPSPWHADGMGVITAADGTFICQVFDNADTGMEDGESTSKKVERVLAAAPMLLFELGELIDEIDGPATGNIDSLMLRLQSARNTIAAATSAPSEDDEEKPQQPGPIRVGGWRPGQPKD